MELSAHAGQARTRARVRASTKRRPFFRLGFYETTRFTGHYAFTPRESDAVRFRE